MFARHAPWLAVMAALMLAGCSLALTPEPTLTPIASAAPSATPDIYATAAQKTLAAMAAQATARVFTLTAEASAGAALARPTASPPGPAAPASTDTPTPTDMPSPAPTVTLTPTPEPGRPAPEGGTPFATSQPVGLIRSFEALPAQIDPGDPITLTWSAQGDWATLYRLSALNTLAESWEVPLAGARTFETDLNVRNTVRYVLFVGRGALTESAMATVVVRCPVGWFFDNPPEDCPQSAAQVGSGAAQRFEHGRMIWLATERHIYVLFSDGGSPSYSIYSDPWEPGMPESDPSITPPEGYVAPVRGFGMVWRGEGGAMPDVRERLGWALEPEQGYDGGAVQCDSAPKYNTCYLGGSGGEVIVLEPERSGWYVWQGPGGAVGDGSQGGAP